MNPFAIEGITTIRIRRTATAALGALLAGIVSGARHVRRNPSPARTRQTRRPSPERARAPEPFMSVEAGPAGGPRKHPSSKRVGGALLFAATHHRHGAPRPARAAHVPAEAGARNGDRQKGPRHRGFTSLIASEWIKTRSVRGTWVTVAATVLVTVAIGALGISGFLGEWTEELPDPWDPTGNGLKGILVGQLLIGMLGASAITGEYATGMIATSLSVAPGRRTLLAAKAVVATLVALGTSVLAVGLGFAVTQALVAAAGLPAASLAAPGVVVALLCAVAYLTLTALLGLAFGVITRSSSGALAIIVGISLIAPAVLPALPGGLGGFFSTYWPTTAGQAAYTVADTGGTSPAVGIGILALFTLCLTLVSHITLHVRDA
ncbi:hypothetical protein GCM10027160_32360 [Streptomyces calidiresistens]|uniref:ABC transporter permease subunit n=1 Tax=Streptomyces calidiresistens TaxID=1485586 RepID=A0A7W3XWY6_9ACTN|nr:ABC transporter permease [Streptomyces calidiresistens]MBB0230333.1 ABC transporter permease subunit [Streptomyces calidiresistens]